jgi:YVTN family beta-propeller protein
MKTVSVIVMAMVAVTGCSGATIGTPLGLQQTIRLDGVSRRIDHMALDPEGHRLFVACLGNDTVEVIDTAAGKRIGTINALHEPQGVLFIAEFNRIIIANAGDGTVCFFDGTSLQLIKTIDLKDDADNLRYDKDAKRIYVGYGSGALGVLSAETGAQIADFKLPGHPESFELETKGTRIFVNVPTAGQVVVIDRKKGAAVAAWPLKGVGGNFPMAMDEANGRLFIGCRSPAKLLVLDTGSGNVVAALDCVGDADDVFYDPSRHRVYVSGGGGRIDVFERTGADHFQLISQTPTATGARTSFLVASPGALYLAVPHLLFREAELRVYTTR